MIPKSTWKPVDIKGLEPAADSVVRSTSSCLVAAGPGAGKTELLAQRACFLLQTGECPAPRRILAISFKRDAAANLRERVSRRCGRDLAMRFDSLTFDSFSKGLVDRFFEALPAQFRPKPDYKILASELTDRSVLTYISEIPSSICGLSRVQIAALNQRQLWQDFNSRSIPNGGAWVNTTSEERAAAALWAHLVSGGGTSSLTFQMIGRMAEFLLRSNPSIKAALRASYPFVFLDEFQDTTEIQYALTRTAFKGSASVMTAVGDTKQRIMGWAGAKDRVFQAFATDFSAPTIPLKRNYRSRKTLVDIQTVVARSIDGEAVAAEAMDDSGAAGECRALAFRSEEDEAAALTEMFVEWIRCDGIAPRDICILCRMKEGAYTEKLRAALAASGIRARVEKDFQDLLAEPLCEFLLDVLKISWAAPAPESWERALTTLTDLRGDRTERGMSKASVDLSAFAASLAANTGRSAVAADVSVVLNSIMSFAGAVAFRSLHPQYGQGDWYAKTIESIVKHLSDARTTRSWPEAIAELEGRDSIPIMTTHKSKGLEYHTVVFVGLEDGAYFSFARESIEETCNFFVALSRAKRRVYFTFSSLRAAQRDSRTSRSSLQPLYQLLANAGVSVEHISNR